MYTRFFTAVAVILAVTLSLTVTASANDRPGVGPAGPANGPRAAPNAGGGKSPSDLLKERRAKQKSDRIRGVTPRDAAPTAPRPTPTPVAEPTPAPRDPSLVGLHHGKVTVVADLARVDLTLAVQNTGNTPLEWTQTYAVDPKAELIGATLARAGVPPIAARTLTQADAGRIYEEARGPRTPQTTPGKKDPLLIERRARDRLSIVVFPVNPGETVEIELTFVTPLRGRGAMRIFEDVMGGEGTIDRSAIPAVAEDRGRQPTTPVETPDGAEWIVEAGLLVLDSEPQGMELVEERDDGLLRFKGVARTDAASPRPSIPFLVPHPEDKAISVSGGSFGGRTAVWRLDPTAFLEAKGLPTRGSTLHLRAVRGSTSRLAPNEMRGTDEPLPITARIGSRAKELEFDVLVQAVDGRYIGRFHERLPIERVKATRDEAGTITGWHRAMLVERVTGWAGSNPARTLQALRYAVDLGVLVPGTAALAIPPAEQRRLSGPSRTIYKTDGAPLGAQRREADMKAPPSGSMSVR